jgi:hypothetical protein
MLAMMGAPKSIPVTQSSLFAFDVLLVEHGKMCITLLLLLIKYTHERAFSVLLSQPCHWICITATITVYES